MPLLLCRDLRHFAMSSPVFRRASSPCNSEPCTHPEPLLPLLYQQSKPSPVAVRAFSFLKITQTEVYPLTTRITELSAVNAMLAVIGEAPLSTLDGNALHADAVSARQTLHNTSRSVQAEGWYFNTEYNYPLTPDRDGFVTLPPDIVSVDVEPLNTGWRNVDVVVRGKRLYDLENHTYAFDPETCYKATVLLILPFDELPETAKDYIMIRAGRRFQGEAVGSETLAQFTQQDEFNARASLMREQIRNNDSNFLSPHRNSTFGMNTINRITNRRL